MSPPNLTLSRFLRAAQLLLPEFRSAFRSRLLRIAVVCVAAGLGIEALRHRAPSDSPAPVREIPATTPGSNPGAPPATPQPPRSRSPDSPALFRFGASYIGGFVVGFLIRRFIRLTALAGAAALGTIALLRSTGFIDLDWAALENHVRDSLAWLNGKASALQTFLTGYLPSAGAGGLGLWRGARWTSEPSEPSEPSP